jgi:hypothetical protein
MARNHRTYRRVRRSLTSGRPPNRSQPPRKKILRWQDVVGLLGVPLAFAGLRSEDTVFVTVCFVLAAGVISFGVATYHDLAYRYRAVIISGIVIVFGVLGIYIWHSNIQKTLASNEGVLEPGNEKAEDRKCDPPTSEAVALYIGPHTFYIHQFPQRIITIAHKDILTLNKVGDNLVITTLRLYPEVGDIFARIDENGFWISPNIRKVHPNTHTLIIYDGNDDEALNINYANTRVVFINGIFRYKGKMALFMPHWSKMDGISGPGGACSRDATFGTIFDIQ